MLRCRKAGARLVEGVKRPLEIMRNSATSKARPRAESHSVHGVESAPTRKTLVRKPRWLSDLGRVLHLARRPPRRAAAPASLSTPAPVSEPLPDLAAAMTPFDRLYELAPRLRRAWSAGTSVWPDSWTPDRPALGQSAATACAVQDVLGGDIVETKMVLADGRTASHFANVVDGLVIDLAQTEVEHATVVPGPPDEHHEFASMRAFVLAQPGAEIGYAALKSRLTVAVGAAR